MKPANSRVSPAGVPRRRAVFSAAAAVAALAALTQLPTAYAASGHAGPSGLDLFEGAAQPVAGELTGVSALSNKNVWTSGMDFSTGASVTLARHWNGKNWKVVATPNPDGSTGSNLLAISAHKGKDIWAVGTSTDASGTTLPLTEHWDGSSWTIVPAPAPDGATSTTPRGVAAISHKNAWLVGLNIGSAIGPLAEHWNGRKWSLVDVPLPEGAAQGFLTSVTAQSPNDVWAGGVWLDASYVGHALVEHWDGTAWTPTATQDISGATYDAIAAVTEIAPDDVWATGATDDSAGDQMTLTEHWDGSAWTIVTSPNPSGATFTEVSSGSASGPDDVWMVGDYLDSLGAFRNLIEHWDGTQWTLLEAPNVIEANENYLVGVSVVSGNRAWASGYAVTQEGTNLVSDFHWNGKAWSEKDHHKH